MKKKILQQAFEELIDAIAYYEERQAGLWLRLKDEFDQHVMDFKQSNSSTDSQRWLPTCQFESISILYTVYNSGRNIVDSRFCTQS